MFTGRRSFGISINFTMVANAFAGFVILIVDFVVSYLFNRFLESNLDKF
jgi:hypothetical protein